MGRIIGRGQDRLSRDIEDGIAPEPFPQRDQHDVVRLGRGAFQIAQQLANDRMALVAQGGERKDHILGGHRRFVVKTRLGPQMEAGAPLVGGNLDRVGEEAVDGVVLVEARGHQAVVDQAEADGGIAGQDIAVERIIGRGDGFLDQLPALGRVRPHIGEIGEVFRQVQFAEGGKAIGLAPVGGFCASDLGASRPAEQRQSGQRPGGGRQERGAAGQREFWKGMQMGLGNAQRFAGHYVAFASRG